MQLIKKTEDLWQSGDIAQHYGITNHLVCHHAKNPKFPQPKGYFFYRSGMSAKLWDKAEIKQYFIDNPCRKFNDRIDQTKEAIFNRAARAFITRPPIDAQCTRY